MELRKRAVAFKYEMINGRYAELNRYSAHPMNDKQITELLCKYKITPLMEYDSVRDGLSDLIELNNNILDELRPCRDYYLLQSDDRYGIDAMFDNFIYKNRYNRENRKDWPVEKTRSRIWLSCLLDWVSSELGEEFLIPNGRFVLLFGDDEPDQVQTSDKTMKARYGKEWTKPQEDKLRKLVSDGKSLAYIVKELDRTKGSVSGKMQEIGLRISKNDHVANGLEK